MTTRDEAALEKLIADMRTVAMMARTDANFAEYATGWAARLAAALRVSGEPPAEKVVGVTVDIEAEAVSWIAHAASLRDQTLGEYIKRAVNAALRKQGVDAVLIAESDDEPPARVSGEEPAPAPSMADAAEMLWVVLANVSGGDWTKQTPDWQEAAARWRDNYFAALKALAATSVVGDVRADLFLAKESVTHIIRALKAENSSPDILLDDAEAALIALGDLELLVVGDVPPPTAEAWQKRMNTVLAAIDGALDELKVKCQGCGQKIIWTSLYGDWCSTCKPRTL